MRIQLATMKDLSKLQLVSDGGEPEYGCNPKQHMRSNAIVKPSVNEQYFDDDVD